MCGLSTLSEARAINRSERHLATLLRTHFSPPNSEMHSDGIRQWCLVAVVVQTPTAAEAGFL